MFRVVLALAVMLSLAVASQASAAYYVGKPVAEHYLRQLLHSTYGYYQTGVYCRPKEGFNESTRKNGRRLYHIWYCGFYARNYGQPCKGLISIKGSDGDGGFRYYRHWSRGPGC